MSQTDIAAAVSRLQQHFPIHQRQQALSDELKQLHCLLLNALVREGYPPSTERMQACLTSVSLQDGLQQLAAQDLIVLDENKVVGAYPATIEQTSHQVMINGQHHIHAMCALDALAIAPTFRVSVQIESRCAVSGYFLLITMKNQIVISSDHPNIMLGVQWQDPQEGCAAHSMCRDMVFLRDETMAKQWSQGKDASVFSIHDAAAFATQFFQPLAEACR